VRNDANLELLVFRSAQRSAELKRNPQGARRANFLAMQPDEADSYGRNAFLEIMGERAHGARAERSDRREQNRVDPI
jgi:hypothetical protein